MHKFLSWLKTLLHTIFSIVRRFSKKICFNFLKRLWKSLSYKWNRPYSFIISFVRKHFAITLVRIKNRSFRGLRMLSITMSKNHTCVDGVGLILHSKPYNFVSFTKFFTVTDTSTWTFYMRRSNDLLFLPVFVNQLVCSLIILH